MIASVGVEEALVILKVLFLLLLYLFIWRIVRTGARDLRLPQESFVLAPPQAAGPLGRARVELGRLVVVSSPALATGEVHVLDSALLTIGRSGENDIPIADDEFASARHARIEPRRDGAWVGDAGSTNGTFVNGARISRPHRLSPGDVIRVGETDLRFER